MQLVSKISIVSAPDRPTVQTDRRTDGRHAWCNRITALCTIVHRAVTTTTTTTFLREQQCSTPVPHLAY